MANFNEVPYISRKDILKAFSSGVPEEICKALVSAVFHDTDWQWLQNRCLEFLGSDNADISGLAATCLGHIARIHRAMEKERVLAALHRYLDDPRIGGRVQDALDDIEMYI